MTDLSALRGHPLCPGRQLAPRSGVRRTAPIKRKGWEHRQLWRIVDGAVRDALANHPEYLTKVGRAKAQGSIVKRVVGAIHGHAEQSARGRSANEAAANEGMAGTSDSRPATGLILRVRRAHQAVITWWAKFSGAQHD